MGGAAGLDPQRRRAAKAAARQRYGGLSSAGKKALVDELVAITGYHRKSVLRALNRKHPSSATEVGDGPGPTESRAQGSWYGHAGVGFIGTALVP